MFNNREMSAAKFKSIFKKKLLKITLFIIETVDNKWNDVSVIDFSIDSNH